MSRNIQKIGTRSDDDDHPHGDIECSGEAVSSKLAFHVSLRNLKRNFGR